MLTYLYITNNNQIEINLILISIEFKYIKCKQISTVHSLSNQCLIFKYNKLSNYFYIQIQLYLILTISNNSINSYT